jgi:hypothetical protein
MKDQEYNINVSPWTTYTTAAGETKTEFEENDALALLLSHQVLFINNHWFEKEFSEHQKQLFSINLNVNDCFNYGADAEEVLYSEFEDLFKHYEKDPDYGPIVWCAKKRKMKPLPGICKWIAHHGIWNLDNELSN